MGIRVTFSLSNFHIGGVLVSTDGLRWGLHAADDASPRNNRIKQITANSNELALAA
jgi:hypothetical protein